MIEFKADCGHTVRARDEDAGGVVRCSYCGRNAAVPDNKESDLDFLFGELRQSAETAPGKKEGGGRRRSFFRRRSRARGDFDPFAIVLRLCYAAALLIVVIVVGRKFILPLVRGGFPSFSTAPSAAPADRPVRKERDLPVGAEPARQAKGLITGGNLQGLYVGSTPPGAKAYCVDASQAPTRGRIHKLRGCQEFQANAKSLDVGDGVYVVEVVFAWNDPNLTGFRNYAAFRSSIEKASEADRRRHLDQYFIPDDANEVFVDPADDQIYLVHQFRDVEVRGKKSSGVRALFLPRIPRADGRSFSVGDLLALEYLPDRKNYAFDRVHARNELAYYGVAESDQPYVLEALERIGVIACPTAERGIRLFKIGIHDGESSSKAVRTAGE